MVTDTPLAARDDSTALPLFSVPIKSGTTELRLARDDADIEAAQELRYRVFYEEMGAVASPETAALKLDRDGFDTEADHLLVVDHATGGGVVGTYRLLRRRIAERRHGFYTSKEYDISKLVALNEEILELGRSCVDARYRNRATMQMLWTGIAAYIFHYEIHLMFGCACFPGMDPERHAQALSYLHHHHRAPSRLRPRALSKHYVDMNLKRREAIDVKAARDELPPLIKGYLRIGGWVGDGAVIDRQFNSTDVCVVVHADSLPHRYHLHYERTTRGGVAR